MERSERESRPLPGVEWRGLWWIYTNNDLQVKLWLNIRISTCTEGRERNPQQKTLVWADPWFLGEYVWMKHKGSPMCILQDLTGVDPQHLTRATGRECYLRFMSVTTPPTYKHRPGNPLSTLEESWTSWVVLVRQMAVLEKQGRVYMGIYYMTVVS